MVGWFTARCTVSRTDHNCILPGRTAIKRAPTNKVNMLKVYCLSHFNMWMHAVCLPFLNDVNTTSSVIFASHGMLRFQTINYCSISDQSTLSEQQSTRLIIDLNLIKALISVLSKHPIHCTNLRSSEPPRTNHTEHHIAWISCPGPSQEPSERLLGSSPVVL